MGPVSLFDVLSRHSQWLSVRQSLIAGNIANASTPAFKPLDVAPFEKVLDTTKLELATTRPGHLDLPTADGAAVAAVRDEDAVEISHSGNSVNLEQEGGRRQPLVQAQCQRRQSLPSYAAGEREDLTCTILYRWP